jgi:hypothetical protein
MAHIARFAPATMLGLRRVRNIVTYTAARRALRDVAKQASK